MNHEHCLPYGVTQQDNEYADLYLVLRYPVHYGWRIKYLNVSVLLLQLLLAV